MAKWLVLHYRRMVKAVKYLRHTQFFRANNMQIKFNIPQAEQVNFRSRLGTSFLVFARSLAVDLWQVYANNNWKATKT